MKSMLALNLWTDKAGNLKNKRRKKMEKTPELKDCSLINVKRMKSGRSIQPREGNKKRIIRKQHETWKTNSGNFYFTKITANKKLKLKFQTRFCLSAHNLERLFFRLWLVVSSAFRRTEAAILAAIIKQTTIRYITGNSWHFLQKYVSFV